MAGGMRAYWFKFSNRGPACVYAKDEPSALALASRAGSVISVEVLGYPANPRLDDLDGWEDGKCPSFCIRPELCAQAPDRHGCCANPYGRSCTS